MTDIDSIEDIFNSDTFGLLDDKSEVDIFTLKNISKIDQKRADADFVARRKQMKDFDKYEKMFLQCQKDLREGTRTLVKFNEKSFEKGIFFVLKGVLGYIKEMKDINTLEKDKNSKIDTRTVLIFENGTSSNMLLRSLGKGLYENGYLVSEKEENSLNRFEQIDNTDEQNGYVYILSSLSNDDRIVTKKNLFKIGFSTTEVKTRIQNAKKDPTYLMAEVKEVSSFEVYNINPHKLEKLIHKFFSHSCLNIDIFDEKGLVCRPREWFIAPLKVIETAINMIINGSIVNYRYDTKTESIRLK